MPALLVRDLPQATLDALKRRAEQHHRSLQQELHVILELAAQQETVSSPVEMAEQIRAKPGLGVAFGDSTLLVREDRER